MKNNIELKFTGKCEYSDDLRFKDTISGDVIYVKSFKDGVLETNPICGNDINSVSKFVEKMFNEISNVEIEINNAFENNPIQSINTICFDFNGISITADINTTANDMVKQLYDGYEVARMKRDAEYEEYKKTPQYAIDMAEKARKDAEKKIIIDEVIKIDETTEMEFKDEDGWNKTVEVNSDGYGGGVITYARRFAKCMQDRISKESSVVEAANEFQFNADLEGITGFMYGCAINILSQTWKYGEELRKWHNKEYDYEGDGCVNPAILTIG